LKTGAQDTILPHNPWMVSGMPKTMWHCLIAPTAGEGINAVAVL
jgi:hypothetical protein